MKTRWFFLFLVLLTSASLLAAEIPANLYSNNPIVFEPNRGQAASPVKFLSRGNGYGLYLTPTEAVLTLARPEPFSIGMKLVGQKTRPVMEGLERQSGVSHYLRGAERQDWMNSIPHYAKVRYDSVYPGIDVVYYGREGQLEYDFIVQPRANPRLIELDFSGVEKLSIDRGGDLVLHTESGEVRHQSPIAYQEHNGKRTPVEAEFLLQGGTRVTFKLGAYDRSRTLTVDPKLLWSSYLGGSVNDAGNDLALDSDGNVYITGYTMSADYWGVNPLQPDLRGDMDAFVTKIDALTATVAYSTFIGGTGLDEGHDIAVDGVGNMYITGYTRSTDFPVTNGSTRRGNQDAYVVKLNNSGTAIQYATYLGGGQISGNGNPIEEHGLAIAVDTAGNAFVTGMTSTTDFPTTNAYRPNYAGGGKDAFVTHLAPNGSLVYSTYLGGLGEDQGYDIALGSDGSVVVTGYTSCCADPNQAGFPRVNALTTQYAGGEYDAFITKFSPSGNTLVFSTTLGGSGLDQGVGLAVDDNDFIYVTGVTSSAFDFPLKNPAQLFHAGVFDAFLIKLQPDGQDAVFSTYIGGEDQDTGSSVAVGSDGSIYLAGNTNSTQFYAINSLSGFLRGILDGFVLRIEPDASSVVFSTYLGGFGADAITGLALDATGNAYVTGLTSSIDFAIAPNAFWPTLSGPQDSFIVKINSDDIVTGSSYVVPANGGATIATAGQTALPIFGYAVADIASGLTPSGLEIVDLRSVGTLVNEVSIPAPFPASAGRLYARTTPGDATALSIVNPNSSSVHIDFFFTPEDGSTDYSEPGAFDLPANSHVSGFLYSEPFNISANRSGTFTFFTDGTPLVTAALRVDTSGVNPVNSHVPIVNPFLTNNRPVSVPQFADGLGWTTQFYMVNTSDRQMNGELRLFKNNPAGGPGIPAELATEQGVNSVFPYSIPSRSAKALITRGESGELIAGHADIVPLGDSDTPATFAILTFSENGGLLKTTVQAQEPGTEFKMYVESSGTFGEHLAATPSIAVGNASDSDAVVQLELVGLDGTPSGLSAAITIPAKGHLSAYVKNIPGFENLPSPYQGVLRATTSSPGITIAGFRCRYNEQNQFLALTTGPLPDLSGVSSAIFPHLVDGGGYATQFILINGSSGAGASGVLRYLNQSGLPLHMAITD